MRTRHCRWVLIFKIVIEGEEVMTYIKEKQYQSIKEIKRMEQWQHQQLERAARVRLGIPEECNHERFEKPTKREVIALCALGAIGLIISIVCVVLQ